MNVPSSFFACLVCALFLTLYSCKKDSGDVQPADSSLQSFMTTQRNDKQTFRVSIDQNTIITGANGTNVYLGFNTLCYADGTPVTGDVTVELKEVLNASDMILNNAPTVSNGKLLKSGGEIYVNCIQNGQTLTLKDNAAFFIKMPAVNGTSDSMNVFTGTDSSGIITWTPVNADTINQNTPLPPDSINKAGIFDTSSFMAANPDWAIVNQLQSYMVRCTSFGWINCDHFINYPSVCNIQINTDTSFKNSSTRVYCVLPSYNSICQAWLLNNGRFSYGSGLPDDVAVKIVGIAYKNGQYYIGIKDHFIHCGTNTEAFLTFDEVAESDIESVLQTVNQ